MQYSREPRTCIGSGALLLAGLLALTGCAVETGELDADQASRSQALQCSPSGPGCPWNNPMARHATGNVANDIDHRKSPALLTAEAGGLTISTDTSNRYRTLAWHTVPAATWGSYGTKQFSSRPTITYRENDASGLTGFVMGGKATDNTLWTSAGRYSAFANPPANPVAVEAWTQVSTTAYTVNGSPALGTNPSAMVMIFMGDDRRTVYAHTRDLPYVGNSWSARITGPTLPSGWSVYGAPGILFQGVTFTIVVHAENATRTSDRLYATHFYAAGPSGPENFSSNIGTAPGVWTQLPSLGIIDGDPAITYHPEHGYTIYFRRGSNLMQTSAAYFADWGDNPVLEVDDGGVSFTESPAASAERAMATNVGKHTVVMRSPEAPPVTGKLYLTMSQTDNQVLP